MEFTIILKDMQEALSFVHINEQAPCDIDLISGKYVVNAKSIMSVLGAEILGHVAKVRLLGDASACTEIYAAYREAGFNIEGV